MIVTTTTDLLRPFTTLSSTAATIPTTMSLIHALIARGTTVLAEHSQGSELKPGASTANVT
jgi:hypothetical protein